uniref:Uncharacterized protein n=1 Tax=mine drainage metagenome TaxID=410659 RepID=E6PX07_9ZZZZ
MLQYVSDIVQDLICDINFSSPESMQPIQNNQKQEPTHKLFKDKFLIAAFVIQGCPH